MIWVIKPIIRAVARQTSWSGNLQIFNYISMQILIQEDYIYKKHIYRKCNNKEVFGLSLLSWHALCLKEGWNKKYIYLDMGTGQQDNRQCR